MAGIDVKVEFNFQVMVTLFIVKLSSTCAGYTRMIGLPYAGESMMTLSRLNTILERDRPTDRIAISRSHVSIALLTRDKNETLVTDHCSRRGDAA